MRALDLLVILALAVFWYGLVPAGGALLSRQIWRSFRRRLDNLRLKPLLTYGMYRAIEGEGIFRFSGGFESVTDGHTLWIRGEELTIPLSLKGALTYRLPMSDIRSTAWGPEDETPERIRWDRVSIMTEGIKVFVGGTLIRRENRYIFESVPEQPLLVIFYDGPDRSLAPRAVSSGRHKNEYWNYVTPYAFILGAFSQILMAVGYIPRPAFRLTAVAAFIAIFIPLFPLIPPGLIFTLGYRRLWWLARIYRAYRDLVRLPWRHIIPGSSQGRLPDGEPYIARYYETLPPEVYSQGIPFIIPPEENGKGLFRPRRQGKSWYIFGVLNPEDNAETALPRAPSDPFAIYGILPGKGRSLSRHYNIRGYVYGGIALVLLLSAVALNMFFIVLICFLLLL